MYLKTLLSYKEKRKMDKKIIIGLAVGGAAVASGIVVGVVKLVKTVKTAKKAGIPVKEFMASQNKIRKANREAKRAEKRAAKERTKAA
jgi:hypothetical protein